MLYRRCITKGNIQVWRAIKHFIDINMFPFVRLNLNTFPRLLPLCHLNLNDSRGEQDEKLFKGKDKITHFSQGSFIFFYRLLLFCSDIKRHLPCLSWVSFTYGETEIFLYGYLFKEFVGHFKRHFFYLFTGILSKYPPAFCVKKVRTLI